MLKEETVVFFLINGYIMSGRVINIEGNDEDYNFSIEGYAGCSGPHIIASSKFTIQFFLRKKKQKSIKIILRCIYHHIVNVKRVLMI